MGRPLRTNGREAKPRFWLAEPRFRRTHSTASSLRSFCLDSGVNPVRSSIRSAFSRPALGAGTSRLRGIDDNGSPQPAAAIARVGRSREG